MVEVSGGGGKGNIGNPRSEEKPMGIAARLEASGEEASECEPGFERTNSQAFGEARVDQGNPGEVRFSYRLKAHGGHYATAAQCIGKTVIGKTGHDTTATATAEMRSTIFVLIRSDKSPSMRVEYEDMPPDTQIKVIDWRSEPLMTARREFRNGDWTTVRTPVLATVSGGGSQTVETHGPGYYRVETTVRLDAAVTGNSGEAKEKAASVRVSLINS